MIPQLQHLRMALDAFQPGAFNALLAALLFVALWGVRRWKPLFFAKLPPALQAWPALASGMGIAALSASPDGNVLGAVTNALGMALTGLVSGMLASGIHRTLKEAPIPYGSTQIPPKSGRGPTAGLGATVGILALLALPGCGLLSDPTSHKVTCNVTGAALQALAVDLGLPPDVVLALYEPGCMAAARAGASQDQASEAGRAGAKRVAARLRSMRARFVESDAGVSP